MTRIEVNGITGHGWHGVLEHERREGQEFRVDLAMDVDTAQAASTDDLAHTVDYGMVARLVHAHIVGTPLNLVETLASNIADAVMGIERVQAVTVSVHKPHAPIPVAFDDVIVTVHRTR